MSTLKTKIGKSEVLQFLKNNFDTRVDSLDLLKGGEMSQAFSFSTEKGNFVIRINSTKYSFEKDKYAHESFANIHIPIPKIYEIGSINEKYFYCISELAKGKNLNLYQKNQREHLIPILLKTLDAIHDLPLADGQYGFWDKDGVATFSSWKEFILSYKDEVYSNWDTLSKATFIEKEVVDDVLRKITELSNTLPQIRTLIHGDFGFDNVIFDGDKITGILDWGESTYGDFLFDAAWLAFWSDEFDYKQLFLKYYQEKGVDIQNYESRMLCYQLHLGLGALGFFALSEQKDKYDLVKKKLLSMM